jgi:hypothetical protein
MRVKTQPDEFTLILVGILREVEASLRAGRISAGQAEILRRTIRENPSNCDRNTLRDYEKLHRLHKYIEFRGPGFTIHEFTYRYQLPDSEKQKIIAALEEALAIIKIDRKVGEYK